MRFDVAVVGAGPAGSTAARVLAEAGFKVALLEEHEEVGIPQHCAGMIIKKGCELLSVRVPDEVVQAEPSTVRIHYVGRELEVGLELYIVDRASFDKHLAELAASSGAELLTGHKVLRANRLGRESWSLTTKRGRELRADLLIGADGYKAVSPSWAGLERPRDVASCIQYELELDEEVDTSVIDCFFGSDCAPGGYAWAVPIGERSIRIGLGVRGAPRPAKAYLDALVASEFPRARISRRLAGLVHVGGPIRPSYTDAFMAVGEAAGQVNPLLGTGILSAIASARIAGQVATRALEEGDLSSPRLSEYERKWLELLGPAYELSMATRQLLQGPARGAIEELLAASKRGRIHVAIRALELLVRCPTLLKHALRWRRAGMAFFI